MKNFDPFLPDFRGIVRGWRRCLTAAVLACGFLAAGVACAQAPVYYGYSPGGQRRGLSALVQLCKDRPLLGIPLAVVFLGLAAFLVVRLVRDMTTRHQDVVIRRFARERDVADRLANVDIVKRHDPKFAEALLAERVQRAFTTVQRALLDRHVDRLAAFVSDGAYGNFAAQIEESRIHDGGGGARFSKVEDIALVEAHSDGRFDAVTFRVSATMVEPPSTRGAARPQSESQELAAAAEFWSFIRRVDAKTLRGGGLIEGRCPACGTELKTDGADKCHACQAPVRNGDDWTLWRTTKACDWQMRNKLPVPGAADLSTRDPEFSLASLEDRAAVVFWRLLAAMRKGRVEAVEKVATAEFCHEFAQGLLRDPRGVRSYPANCAIGSVEACAIVLGRDWDKAVVKIRWSGFLTEEDSLGRMRQTHTAQIRTEAFILARQPGVKTRPGGAFAGAHCPTCGHPPGESPGGACDACGAMLASAAGDWVLVARKAMVDREVHSLLAMAATSAHGKSAGAPPVPPPRPGSNLEQAAWMVSVMVSNGVIDAREKELLENFALHRGLTTRHIDQLTQSALAGALETRIPERVEETRLWLDAMAEVALANGVISKPERAALLALGAHLGYSGYDIDQIILRARTRLYKAGRRGVQR